MITADHDQAPQHLVDHAKTMTLLRLDEIHQTELHSLHTMPVVMTATDTMSTDELEDSGLWLTQCEIDAIDNVPCHGEDKLPESSTAAAAEIKQAMQLYDLRYSDIDAGPKRYGSSVVNGSIGYCFYTYYPWTSPESTKAAMRAAFARAESEINALGSCLTFTDQGPLRRQRFIPEHDHRVQD